jgi:chromosome segregation ATPase
MTAEQTDDFYNRLEALSTLMQQSFEASSRRMDRVEAENQEAALRMDKLEAAIAQERAAIGELRSVINSTNTANQAAIADLRSVINSTNTANQAAIADLRSVINSTNTANQAAIADLRSVINSTNTANQAAIADLRSAVSSMIATVSQHQQNFEVSQRNFERIVAQIRGIQTENRRILDHLFGEQTE